MQTILRGGTILSPDQTFVDHSLTMAGEKILEIAPGSPAPSSASETIDVSGLFVVPGFIDIHVHGAMGSDTMDATGEALWAMSEYYVRHGVTAFLPTTVTASVEDTLAAVRNVANTPQNSSGARHLGIHLEGPCLSHEFRGAQPPQHLRAATPSEYRAWLESDQVRLITVAPEVEGVLDLIRIGRQAGVEFALGHTSATYEQVLVAYEHGLRQATHTFNGMASLNHRIPGAVGAVLSDDRIWAQIIVDGIHVHPAVVKMLVQAKGINRTVIITDAIRATGMSDGDYALGDQLVHVKDGIARTDAGGLAGSTLTMDQALRNVMEFAGLSLVEAVPMLTRVPAASIGVENHKGSLVPGFDADMAILDQAYQVRMTIVGGKVVYSNL